MFYTQAATNGNMPKAPPVFEVQTNDWDKFQRD
jgi:hypothetical protein